MAMTLYYSFTSLGAVLHRLQSDSNSFTRDEATFKRFQLHPHLGSFVVHALHVCRLQDRWLQWEERNALLCLKDWWLAHLKKRQEPKPNLPNSRSRIHSLVLLSKTQPASVRQLDALQPFSGEPIPEGWQTEDLPTQAFAGMHTCSHSHWDDIFTFFLFVPFEFSHQKNV